MIIYDVIGATIIRTLLAPSRWGKVKDRQACLESVGRPNGQHVYAYI
jgi:hypothetical protein